MRERPAVGFGVGGEFVVAMANVLGEGRSRAGRRRLDPVDARRGKLKRQTNLTWMTQSYSWRARRAFCAEARGAHMRRPGWVSGGTLLL